MVLGALALVGLALVGADGVAAAGIQRAGIGSTPLSFEKMCKCDAIDPDLAEVFVLHGLPGVWVSGPASGTLADGVESVGRTLGTGAADSLTARLQTATLAGGWITDISYFRTNIF